VGYEVNVDSVVGSLVGFLGERFRPNTLIQLGGKKTHTLGYAAYACPVFSAHNLGLAAHEYAMYPFDW